MRYRSINIFIIVVNRLWAITTNMVITIDPRLPSTYITHHSHRTARAVIMVGYISSGDPWIKSYDHVCACTFCGKHTVNKYEKIKINSKVCCNLWYILTTYICWSRLILQINHWYKVNDLYIIYSRTRSLLSLISIEHCIILCNFVGFERP